jgi:hypothetical protein
MTEQRCVEHEEKKYLLGSAGSLILACEKCGEEHFREAFNYFRNPEWHTCFTCGREQKMVPILLDELETKWKPFWLSLGDLVRDKDESIEEFEARVALARNNK